MRCTTPIVSMLLTILAPAQEAAIRIERVPDRVRLPAASGANLLVEVEVTGQPTAVWLASDAASQDRLPLVAVGGNRHQANLADPRLFDMLPAGLDRGSLFVMATIGNRTVQSAPIDWARAAPDDGPVRCVVRSDGTKTQTVLPDQPRWIDPRRVGRFEVQGTTARQTAAVARFEDLELPLVRRDGGAWTLDVDQQVRERLAGAATFEIETKVGASSALFAFRCIPQQLELPEEQRPLVVQQRRKATLPGSNGWLEVQIDDITGGRVLLTLATADGSALVPQRVVHERDHVEFQVGEKSYVLYVKRLVNLLIGDDHAEFTVHEARTFAPDRIGQLLRAIEGSEDVFLREGKEHSGSEAARFLQLKLAAHKGGEPTVDQFVDSIASKSSRTGDDYRVRTKAGDDTTMQEWLRSKLRELEKTAARDR